MLGINPAGAGPAEPSVGAGKAAGRSWLPVCPHSAALLSAISQAQEHAPASPCALPDAFSPAWLQGGSAEALTALSLPSEEDSSSHRP